MTKLDALLGMVALLAPKSKAARARVEHAVVDPKGFFAKHARRLHDRNVDKPIASLPWIALVEALEDAKALVEIDWKTDSDELEQAIRKLKKGFRLPAIDELDDRSTWEVLELAGTALRMHGLQLGQLDMSSDNHCLVLLPVERFDELVRLGKAAALGRVEAFGDRLAAATKERVARDRRLAREAKAEENRPRPQWRFFAKGRACWSLLEAPAGFSVDFVAPGKRLVEHHRCMVASRTKAIVKRTIAAWLADGFRELSEAEWKRKFPSPGGYVGWVAPFPEDGVFFLENRTLVRCISRRGDAVVRTGGVIGRDFGEHSHVRHEVDATKAFEEEVKALRAGLRELSRDEVIRQYATRR